MEKKDKVNYIGKFFDLIEECKNDIIEILGDQTVDIEEDSIYPLVTTGDYPFEMHATKIRVSENKKDIELYLTSCQGYSDPDDWYDTSLLMDGSYIFYAYESVYDAINNEQ